MIRTMSLQLSVLLAALMVSPALSKPLTNSESQTRQKQAEEIGDRIVRRLHEARDVAPVFKEHFVSDSSLREREVYLVFGRRLPQNHGQIEHTAIERAYIALWNFWYLLSTYRYAHEAEFEPSKEIESAYNLTNLNLEQVTTTKELEDRFTIKLNAFLDVVRKHIPQNVFESDVYKKNWAEFKEEEETADVEQMRRDFRLAKEKDIYVIKREFFNYFLIQEDETLKVFTMSLRTKKRL